MINSIIPPNGSLKISNPLVTAISVKSISKPDMYELSQNYPNPFNPSTTIKYSLPEDSKVHISIFNTLGQLVRELVNRQEGAGYYQIILKADDLSSGIYYYNLDAQSIDGKQHFRNIKKMLLLK